jgi:hypothetical protein
LLPSMAAKNHKRGDEKKTWQHEECCTNHHGEKTQSVRAHLLNGGQSVSEGRGIWHHRVTDKERKTEQGVAGRHQRMVSDGHPQSQQDGAGPCTMERDRHGGI